MARGRDGLNSSAWTESLANVEEQRGTGIKRQQVAHTDPPPNNTRNHVYMTHLKTWPTTHFLTPLHSRRKEIARP
jgi:hypothetical protein